MKTSALLNNVSRHISLTGDEIAVFDRFWSVRTLAKGDFLLRNGDICRYDSYVMSGVLKAYYINAENGREEILFFAIADWWATDLDSFSKQQPSIYNIQALDDTTVLQIGHHGFQQLLKAIPRLERYFRIILESYVGALQRRIIYRHIYDAETRYRDFLNTYPDIAATVPKYLIASYLGVSAEFLSRVGKKK